MSNYFIYADPHYYHENIIKHEYRPFKTANDMNRCLIDNHNETISKRDRVFILGDFSLGNKEQTKNIVQQLNGYLILIMGNHDRNRSRKWFLDCGFNEVIKYPVIINDNIILSHEPIDNIEGTLFRNIHGHIHGRHLSVPPYINVGLDVTQYKPCSLDNIIGSIV